MARVILVSLAVLLALAPIPPRWVETLYSGFFYPPLQEVLTTLSNLAPFALFDVLLAGFVAWWIWRLWRDISSGRDTPKARPSRPRRGAPAKRGKTAGKRNWWRIAGRVGVRTATAAAAAYLVFLTTWGFQYRRVPIAEKVRFDARSVSLGAALALAGTAVQQVNALYPGSREDNDPPHDRIDPVLAGAFGRTTRLLGLPGQPRPGRPKRTILDPYFRAAGVDGMTDPFFLETLVASNLLPFERPFVLAHEWSHLAGVTNEGEANFAGWLTCVRGDDRIRYSGWLFLYGEAIRGLPARDRAALSAGLADGPREDLQAIAERLRASVNPVVATAGWTVYDKYLKANRVEAGATSYNEVVRLILGTKFSADWTPDMR